MPFPPRPDLALKHLLLLQVLQWVFVVCCLHSLKYFKQNPPEHMHIDTKEEMID